MLRKGPRRQAHLIDEDLLRILARAPDSGHGVVKRLVSEQPASHPYAARSTYLGLHRLERRGLLTSDWRRVLGRSIQAKYYRVTAAGVRRLRAPNATTAAPDFDPVTLLVLVAVIGSGGTFEAQGHDQRPHLTILVDRHVPVSSDELRRASMEVNRLFGAIGVTADWELEQPFEHSASRYARGAPTGFVVHVVIIAKVTGPSFTEVLPLGETPPGQRRDVVVFHDHVQEFAQRA